MARLTCGLTGGAELYALTPAEAAGNEADKRAWAERVRTSSAEQHVPPPPPFRLPPWIFVRGRNSCWEVFRSQQEIMAIDAVAVRGQAAMAKYFFNRFPDLVLKLYVSSLNKQTEPAEGADLAALRQQRQGEAATHAQ